MLGSGRDKIETKEQMEASKKVRTVFALFRVRKRCVFFLHVVAVVVIVTLARIMSPWS